jgi:hypothetical protein
MSRRIKQLAFAGSIALSLLMIPVLAEAQGAAAERKLAPAQGSFDFGLIFNTDNILLGMESYQAGIGAKASSGNLAFRGAFDFILNGAAQSFSLTTGIALEYHLNSEFISPYIGAFADAGYMKQGDLIAAFPFSLGLLAGVEVFVFDFLSVFVEYGFAADCVLTTDLATTQSTFDYTIDTGMGNDKKIGIVVYLQRGGSKKK